MNRWTVQRIIVVVVMSVTVLTLTVLNVRAYRPGDLDTARAQLRFLQRVLADGGAERMQEMFPEGYVFTWSLYGLASAQMARTLPRSDPERRRDLARALDAVMHVRTERARSPFRTDMDPPAGAFYSSWTLYLLAEYVRAAGLEEASPDVVATFRDDARRFAAALQASDSPFLESYPFLVWPADTAVGVAALGIYDRVVAPEFTEVVEAWVLGARQRLDLEVRALSHEARAGTGAPAGGVRGSSLALMSRVLIDADIEFAREQYSILREQFVDQRWLAPGVREYPSGRSGTGDVDSGPIILGFSGPALVVGAAAARAHGDDALADALLSVTEVAGLPVQLRGSRRYFGGLLPVGDAFIAWTRTTPAPDDGLTPGWSPLVSPYWRIPAHLVSLALASLLFLRARSVWRRG